MYEKMGLFRMKIGLKIVSGQLFSQFNFKLIQLFDLPTLLEQAFSSLLLPCKRVTVNLAGKQRIQVLKNAVIVPI